MTIVRKHVLLESMLARLHEINWAALSHAYGQAGDVPEMLQRICAGDDDALDDAWGNIYHQGTTYSATSAAVPFLIEMLRSERADRPGLLRLLHAIAESKGPAGDAVADGMPSFLRLRSDPALDVRLATALS